jgi:exodeoxyribonuclease VII large subunit
MSQDEFQFSRPITPPDADRHTASKHPEESLASSASAKNKIKPSGNKSKSPEVYTVTQLSRLIKLTLSTHLPGRIVLAGEISNFTHHRSGHLYLTLKDENTQIAAVMWRSAAERLKFTPADGLAVQAVGRVDIYEPQGKYQFYIDKLEPAGIGSLELAFRQLADKLRKEGLFDEAHKKNIPSFPETIAIVTSPEGAAIEDIGKTLNRRFPVVRKLLYPVAVQGEAAAADIARAIRDLNRRRTAWGGIDLIIVARGGGSLEDLWAFNEEVVARAIYASDIPILTGIGHEVDTSIADLVADQRAATPTAAAELAAPVLTELLQDLDDARQRLSYILSHRCSSATGALENLYRRPMFSRPLDLVHHRQQFIDEQFAGLARRLSEVLRQAARYLENSADVLRRIEPHYALNQARTQLMEHQHLLQLTLRQFCQTQKHQLENFSVKLRTATPRRLISQQGLVLSHLIERCRKAPAQQTRQRRQRFENCRQRLENLNPRAVLNRGYSITRHKETGKIITALTNIKTGDLLVTELAQNTRLESEVTSTPIQRKENHG